MTRLRLLQFAVVAVAAGAALAPWPPPFIEQYYAGWIYPALQAAVTSWSNETTVSLFDIVLAFLGGGLLVAWVLWLRAVRRERSAWPVLRGLGWTATAAAAVFLWFFGAWGANYSRVPLESRVGFNGARVTPAALGALAGLAVAQANRLYEQAHREGFPAWTEVPPALVASMHGVERVLGRPRAVVPGRPKRTLLAPFFRASGTDGMIAPFLLETLLNPDLTAAERPAVLAHEWAHLSGYASEHEASFVGLAAALRADAPSRYSAWLTIVFDTTAQMGREQGQAVLAALAAGPRQDREAIIARLRTRVEAVQEVSWRAYDHYLKTQGVEEGVQNYGRVVELLLGMDPSHVLYWRNP